MPFKNKADQQAYVKELLADSEYRESRRVWQRNRRNKKKEQLRDIKSRKGCKDCGIKDWRVLDFDHLGNKAFGIADRPDLSWKVILAEVEKCEVRCANCHRIKTIEGKETVP